MKIKDSLIQSAVVGSQKSKQFGVSSNKGILRILRDKIYNDKPGAVCREVATNSRDANIENGKRDVRIKIEIKDTLDQLGIVGDLAISFKDSGIGISPERMDDVFLIYGESTKTENNDEAGCYGIGAKSPFAYGDTFSIVTVCEEKGKRTKYIYVAAIDESEKGTMHMFNSFPTKEETGTEIIVPIKKTDRTEFEHKCIYYTMFWDLTPEYLNFRTVLPIVKKFEFEKFNIFKVDNFPSSINAYSGFIAIDGIPYIYDNNSGSNHYNNDFLLSFPFNNGELDISAGREYLETTASNKTLIQDRKDASVEFSKKYVTKHIKEQKTLAQALIAHRLFNQNNFNIKKLDDEKYLLRVMYNIQLYSGNEDKSVWNKVDLSSFYFLLYKSTFYDKNRLTKSGAVSLKYLMDKHIRSETDLINMYIRSNQTRPVIYLLDTDDKKGQRIWTLLKDVTDRSQILFYKQTTVFEAVERRLNNKYPTYFRFDEIHNTVALQEAALEKIFVTDKEFEKDYKATKAGFEKHFLDETEILNELFDIKKLSDVAPTRIVTKKITAPKAPSKTVNIRYEEMRINDNYNGYSYWSKSFPLIKGKDKMAFKSWIILKAGSIATTGYTGINHGLLKLALAIKYSSGNKNIKVCTASVSYNTMVKHGAIPIEEYVKSLTREQTDGIKKLLRHKNVRPEIISMAYMDNVYFDEKDKKLLDLIKIPLDNNFVSVAEYLKAVKILATKIYESRNIELGNIIKELSSNKDELNNINSLLEKYPMINISKITDYSEKETAILNEYMELVQKSKKKQRQQIIQL